MARRQTIERPKSPYKYTGDINANIRPHEQCEMSEPDGKHQVSPTSWPPRRTRGQVDEPSMSLICDLCGTNVIVYAEHATGELDGVRVILPKGEKAKIPA